MLKQLLLVVSFTVIVLFGGRPAEAVPIISVGTYTVPVTPLEPFLVPIVITGAVDVDFWQFSLTYDPTDLQINDPAVLDILGRPVTEGEFFSSLSLFNLFNPGFIILDGATLEQLGSLLNVNDTFGGSLPGPSGNGILAYVEFVAIGSGESTITVTDPSVTSSAVPEPTTLLLMGTGLLMLGARRIATRKRGNKF